LATRLSARGRLTVFHQRRVNIINRAEATWHAIIVKWTIAWLELATDGYSWLGASYQHNSGSIETAQEASSLAGNTRRPARFKASQWQCRIGSGLSVHPANAYGMCFCRGCNIDLRSRYRVVIRMNATWRRGRGFLVSSEVRCWHRFCGDEFRAGQEIMPWGSQQIVNWMSCMPPKCGKPEVIGKFNEAMVSTASTAAGWLMTIIWQMQQRGCSKALSVNHAELLLRLARVDQRPPSLLSYRTCLLASTAFWDSRSQFVFSRDPLIGFIRRLDSITGFWQVTYNRKLEIAGAVAERRTRIPYRLAEAKLVRHGSSNSKRDNPVLITAVGIQRGDSERGPKRWKNPRCAAPAADLISRRSNPWPSANCL
jgi:hypothetical protein